MDSIPYRRLFPWLNISRAFSIARDPRNLLIALAGLVLMSAGNWFTSHISNEFILSGDIVPYSSSNAPSRRSISPNRIDAQYIGIRLPQENIYVRLWQPFRQLITPAKHIFFPRAGLVSTWADTATSWTLFFWYLLVWSLCGGAITRQAASQFARQKTLSLQESLGFSRKLFVSYFSAPLLPFVAIGALYLLNFAFGLLGLIPEVGPVIVGALWFIPLIFSLLMAIVVVCIAICWPLMYPAISVEGSDAFDGLSRSYSYLIAKPWQLAGYVLFAAVNGIIALGIVQLMLMLTVYLSLWSVTGSWGDRELFFNSEYIYHLLGDSSASEYMVHNSNPGLVAIGYWIEGTRWLLHAFAYSYFWCAATIVYFVVRKSSDGTDLTEMYVPSTESPASKSVPATTLKAVHTDAVPSLGGDGEAPPLKEPPALT
ncbi:MAG: hypothetical protein ACKVT0_24040 [Planctomycetaceae bacterium]